MAAQNFSITIEEKGKRAPEYNIATDFGGQGSLQDLLNFTKRALIVTADQVLGEEQDRGFDEDPVVIVDNRVGKPVQNVKPLGKIEFVSRVSLGTALLEAWDLIDQRSPRVTGTYASQNLVFFNGNQIASSRQELERWVANPPAFKDSDRIRFVNAAPYAHALERYGVTAQRRKRSTRKSKDPKQRQGPRVLKPNGVYALSYRAIRRKFKGNVKVKFQMLPGQLVGITKPLPGRQPNGSPWRSTYDPSGKYNSGYYIYPSILIGVSTGGIVQ